MDDFERELFPLDRIQARKQMSQIDSFARQQAKDTECYYCHKEKTSFCTSHSVPAFCLRKIATNGQLLTLNVVLNSPMDDNEVGINRAGVFHLICQDCDNQVFQAYEDPKSYLTAPPSRTLAQIAMKNYLKEISEKRLSRESYSALEVGFPNAILATELKVIGLDLAELSDAFERAKQGALNGHGPSFNLMYYRLLDYVVPFACQCHIALVCDINGTVINDVYTITPENRMQYLHIAVFPLEKSSAIMLFADSQDKKYTKFQEQLSNLTPEDQLSLINYMVFSYTDNVFLAKSIPKSVFENASFIETCRKYTPAFSETGQLDALPVAIKEYSFLKRHSIPNLLSIEYNLSPYSS